MNATTNRGLGVLSLATMLVSAHYGLGFLLGTAEKARTLGAGGSLYGVSIALGTLAVFTLVEFYWTEIEQIWTLLGNRYGKSVTVGIGLMSWTSFIGIEAVQIIAAASILNVAGMPTLPTMLVLTFLFCILSLLPVDKARWIFQGILLFNIATLVYALWALHGLSEYWRSPIEFIPALRHMSSTESLGISLSTILLVVIDMKCHQFIVQAKDVRTAYLGCSLAALWLFGLAFLPSALVTAAQNAEILPPELASTAIVPYILCWVGGGAHHPWGIVLIAALAVPALGLGSNVLRIQSKTLLDLEIVPNTRQNKILIAAINALLALAIAFKGGEIIDLILEFYAAYLSAALVPFIAYLLAHTGVFTFSHTSVRLSLVMSSLASVAVLTITLFQPTAIAFNSAELTIMAVGVGFGGLGLLGTHAIEKYLLVSQTQEEKQISDSKFKI